MIIGRGRCAELRLLDNDRVLKLYEQRFTLERVEWFADVGQRVRSVGVRTPAITDVVTEGDRAGVVMERVHGETLWEAIRRSPTPKDLGYRLAELHVDIHKYSISGLTSKLDEVSERIQQRAGRSPLAVARAQSIVVSGRRDPQVLIHSDLHPANVMVDDDGSLISIDWDAAQSGPAALDVARTYFLIGQWAVAPGTDPVDPDVRQTVAEAYIERYAEVAYMAIEEVETWFLPLVLARYAEKATEDIPILDEFIRAANTHVGDPDF